MTIAASRPPIPGDLSVTSPLGWAHEVEKELQALDPTGHYVSPTNDQVLVAWAQLEGGHWHNSAYGNPLGTTKKEPGSTSINSVGVQSYTSWREGLQATVAMIRQGNMAGILSALRTGGSPATTATAIGDSPWLNGHTSAPGTPTSYGNRIIGLLGHGYAPATNTTPSAGSGEAASMQQAAFLGGIPGDLIDPFGLLGKAGGAVGGLAGNVVGAAIGDVEDYIGKFAIRVALVIFGAIAVLVGLSILFKGDDEDKSTTTTKSTTDDDGQGDEGDDDERTTETRSTTRTKVPRSSSASAGGSTPNSRSTGKSAGADVKETAEGAAEAV